VSGALIVTTPGTAACIQDRGRFGHRHIGVPWSGTLAPELLAIGNRLVGNADDAPAIECFSGGQAFAADAEAVRVAVAGDAELEVESGGIARHTRAWQSLRLLPGETLRVRAIRDGRVALVALAGIDVPTVLGSASAHTRSGLGGGWLAAGARIECAAAPVQPEWRLDDAPATDDSPIRVIAGPQAAHFTAEAWNTFLNADYRIGQAADRMGMRLEGPTLAHRDAASRDIVSDAVIPGAIQVPGHGQPIVLLADAQTAGGYPKIATVISADLPRLATRRPGETVRFSCVDSVTGEAAARTAHAALQARLAKLRRLTAEGIDLAALYPEND
jgi:allophanate hydrolase